VDGEVRWEVGFDGAENGERRCFREGGIGGFDVRDGEGDFDVGDGEGADFLGGFFVDFCGGVDVVVGDR